MQTQKIDSAIDADQAKKLLQKAIDHIADIYTALGAIPYGIVSKNPSVREAVRFCDDADAKLYELAGDPLPF